MEAGELYIKVEKNTEILNKKIFLGDIAKLYGKNKNMVRDLMKTEFMDINSEENKKYFVSIMKVIETIQKKYPDCKINNLGEEEFIISYVKESKKGKKIEYVKAILVAVVILIGSAFSIMTFNADVSVQEIFNLTYELVLGENAKGNGVIEIAYCIGLPVGIAVFFNHFSRKASRNDPTPLQVQMRTYENESNNAMLENAKREGNTIDVS